MTSLPFIATHKETGERVNILHYKNPRSEFCKGDLMCVYCGEDFYIRGSEFSNYRTHFVHSSKEECDYLLNYHPESPEHLFFKEHLFNHLSIEFEEYTTCTMALEYRISVAGKHGRIADVAVLFPNGWIVCHEIQLAPISIEELNHRTEDYRDAGADVVWWFGGKADTQTNRSWAQENIGSAFSLDFEFIPKEIRMGDNPL
jgi:competence protein CoiA